MMKFVVAHVSINSHKLCCFLFLNYFQIWAKILETVKTSVLLLLWIIKWR